MEDKRITRDNYFLQIAQLVAKRGTCHRRQVGAVLVNDIGHIIATGYNGVPRGFDHCLDGGGEALCPAATALSGTNLDACYAIHAEQNALLQCANVEAIDTCYCTASPCISCIKLLLNTSCKRIIFIEEYPQAYAKNLWLKKHEPHTWQQISI